jgi:outer membrane biosynthesis protein TonB
VKSPGRHGGKGRPDGSGVALAGTAFVHAALAVLVWQTPNDFQLPSVPVYRVELVAAPRPEPEARKAPETLQREAERPLPALRPPRRTSVSEATPPPPEQPEVKREPAPRSTPDVEPMDEPSTGADPATLKVEGAAFRYPEYLRNIVSQVYRRWSRPRTNVSLRAEVLFFVHRDGSVSGFQFTKRSGNFAFDLAAQGAVEAAGNAMAFGPLPDGFPDDVLPVNFFFDPSTLRQEQE